MIAALYFALTIVPPLNAVAFGPIQVRVSEALTALAYFEPAAIPGLWIGAVFANLVGSPFGVIDVVFGAGLTLVAAWLTWKIKTPVLALLPPVILNGVGVSFMLKFLVGAAPNQLYWLVLATVSAGEAVAVYVLGYPLLLLILRTHLFIREDVLAKKLEGR